MALVQHEVEAKFMGEDGTWLFAKGTQTPIAKVEKMVGVVSAEEGKFLLQPSAMVATLKDGFLMVK